LINSSVVGVGDGEGEDVGEVLFGVGGALGEGRAAGDADDDADGEAGEDDVAGEGDCAPITAATPKIMRKKNRAITGVSARSFTNLLNFDLPSP
jgi:hypothetical protein